MSSLNRWHQLIPTKRTQTHINLMGKKCAQKVTKIQGKNGAYEKSLISKMGTSEREEKR